MDTNNKFLRILSSLVVIALLLAAGWHAHRWYSSHTGGKKQRRVSAQGYRFTSPLLDVELPEGMTVSREPIPFKQKIEAFVQKLIKSGQAREVAVYYRDLLDGPWFGINEDMAFNPASMMKVAVMIAWLKRAETRPSVLKSTFTYEGKEDMSVLQEIRPQRTLVAGRSYTVEELLRYMMSYSDNNATTLLYYGLNPTEIDAVLDGMDVDSRIDGDSNVTTVHGYSGFFRILYNAAFLNREMSEKALELLSLQDFTQGMIAGVPKGTVVASKFGELSRGLQEDDKQLHEFGIVYHPSHPYILGIMTRGSDFSKLPRIIATISELTYHEVDSDAGN